MKKRLFSLVLIGYSFLGFAQSNQVDPKLQVESSVRPVNHSQQRPYQGPEVLVWSEDFSNGIPNSWSQQGSTANALWEYRGPSTTPSNSSGARGAFSGVNNNPPTNSPLNSSSTSNGFIIFDSGYLDNGGTSNPLGTGTAPTPHVGRIFSDTIDCSAYTDLALSFQSYARRFFGEFYVAISTDAGATFNDTIEVFPVSQVGVNAATANGALTTLNLSNIIGGQDSVQIQFFFDGRPGNLNGNGYYFWMLDDIELNSISSYSLSAVSSIPQSFICNPSVNNYPVYGTMHQDQIVPVAGDFAIFNDGSAIQSNVKLLIEVWDRDNGTIVHTMQSALGCDTLMPGDTCFPQEMLTASWTPPSTPARYALTYKVESDSMQGSAAYLSTDTLYFEVSDQSYSLAGEPIDNFVGTISANPNMVAMGALFSLENEDPDSLGLGKVYLDGLDLWLSILTDSTADISVAIYDTTGFTFNNGFPAGTTPLYSKTFSLNANLIGQESFFSFQTITPTDTLPLALNTGSYLVIINFFPNATGGTIRIANDQSFDQPGISSVMQLADGNWYGSFASSRTFESPHAALRLAGGGQTGCQITTNTLSLGNCNGQAISSPSGNYTYTQSGVYSDTLVNAAGCDSILTLNVNIGQNTLDSLTIQLCDQSSYLSPAGNTYTQSGVYLDTLSSSAACDSVLRIDLQFFNSNASADTLAVESCAAQYLSPSGQVWTQSGFYTDTLANQNGCDSLIWVDLELIQISTSLTSVLNGTALAANQAQAQYQWYECGGSNLILLPGDTNQVFAPTQNGQYLVVITKGACSDTSACTTIQNISLPEELNQAIQLFPNPNRGQFSISLPAGATVQSVRIYSAIGAFLYEHPRDQALDFDLNLPAGQYFLQLSLAHGQVINRSFQIRP